MTAYPWQARKDWREQPRDDAGRWSAPFGSHAADSHVALDFAHEADRPFLRRVHEKYAGQPHERIKRAAANAGELANGARLNGKHDLARRYRSASSLLWEMAGVMKGATYPWEAKGWDAAKHPRAPKGEHGGEFTSGGGAAPSTPVSRPNADLDAFMSASEPAKPAKPATADPRKNDLLDEAFDPQPPEPERHPSRLTPSYTYGHADDRDSDDKHFAAQLDQANRDVEAAKRRLQAAQRRGPKATPEVQRLRRQLAQQAAKVERLRQRGEPGGQPGMTPLPALPGHYQPNLGERIDSRKPGPMPEEQRPAPIPLEATQNVAVAINGVAPPDHAKKYRDLAKQHSQHAKRAGLDGDKDAAKRHRDIAAQYRRAAGYHELGDADTGERTATYANTLASAVGRPQAAPNAVPPGGPPPLPNGRPGANGANGKPANGPPQLPHERTQAAAVQAGNALAHAMRGGGNVDAVRRQFEQALAAHEAAGMATIDRMVRQKYGSGMRATLAARKAKAAFRAKLDAARQKVGGLAFKGLGGLTLDLSPWPTYPWECKSHDVSGEPRDHGKFARVAGDVPDPDAHARTLAERIGSVPHAVRRRVSGFVRKRYGKLAGRYGEAGARAILGATVLMLPVPVPGSSLIPVAVAECVLRLRRAVAKGAGLDDATIQKEARSLLADLYAEMGETPPGVTKGWDAAAHPRETVAHDDKKPGEFAPAGSGHGGGDSGSLPMETPDASPPKSGNKARERSLTKAQAYDRMKGFQRPGWEPAKKGTTGTGPKVRMMGGALTILPDGGYSVEHSGDRYSEAYKVFQSNDGGLRGKVLPKTFDSIEDAAEFAEARFAMLVDQKYIPKPEDGPLAEAYKRAKDRQLEGVPEPEREKPHLPDGRTIPEGHSACPKCGGYGNIPTFGHVAEGVCFKCEGSGVIKMSKGKAG